MRRFSTSHWKGQSVNLAYMFGFTVSKLDGFPPTRAIFFTFLHFIYSVGSKYILRLLSAELKPVLSHSKKLCIGSNYRQFSANIKIKIIKLIPVLLARSFNPSGLTKLDNIIIFHFNIREKLSIIRCVK